MISAAHLTDSKVDRTTSSQLNVGSKIETFGMTVAMMLNYYLI